MAIKGHSGSCTAGGSVVGTAKAWSVDISADTADTTKFSDGDWRTSESLLKQWSGSITVIFDAGGDAGEAKLIESLTAGSPVDLVLNTSATGTGAAEKYSGSANITSLPVSSEVGSIIEVSFSFQGSGELALAALV